MMAGRNAGKPPKKLYRDYDSVLRRYSQWLLTLRKDGLLVVDGRTPMIEYTRRQREKDPNFSLSRDGIHPGSDGHRLMAESLLQAWGVPEARLAAFREAVESGKEAAEVLRLIQQKWKILGPAWLYRVGHKRNPAPIDFEAAREQAAAVEKAARSLAASLN